ncbi:HipA domain-containing protein (plasmid) [Xanthomonas citri pv. citri]|uniref:type II toxin-antitoxin system HipA family toxin n=1 Tax=Xanthomonas citri TaxID=346 RepID=UPI0019324D01|nr:HipA domain-containing protein [Xanthomonas citri]QRD62676.1 HipA domain-containing protein [Xanthomonas citri pv. citri]QRD67211.1 HipA domain-containing protein [Xanthomonas citri pv. citri]QRD71744.1 HipA domain-containing protein [Xanthomonas citri pv. citri]
MTTRYVFIHLPGQLDAVPAGRLELVSAGGQLHTSRYRYGNVYLQRGDRMEVDPISLPLLAGDDYERTPVNGLELFGAIRDASPDAWGRRVIENRLRRPGPLPEVDYLDNAGSDRSGALDIRRDAASPAGANTLPHHINLPYLLEAVERIDAGEQVPAQLAQYFDGGPTMGGMRPKAVVVKDGRQYVAKFPSRRDTRFNVPSVEFATLSLAKLSGLNVPDIDLVQLGRDQSVMMIERFDREPVEGGLARRHMVSGLTMLGMQEMQSPDGSYAALADVISTRGVAANVQADRTELFKRMVFNILVTNNDDHLRNHAFLFGQSTALANGERKGYWRLSPLYDVVPSPEVGTDRYLAIGVGEQGRLATLDNALSSAGQFGLHRADALAIIMEMVASVRPWKGVFEDCGVAGRDIDAVERAFRRPMDIGLRQIQRGEN